jgi:tetratricopeptide (TPR) repeat protein
MLALLLTLAHADVPLPDYTNEVVVAAWFDLDRRISDACTWPDAGPDAGLPPLSCSETRLDAAIAHGERFLTQVRDDGRIRYLMALAHRHAGRLEDAEAELVRAVGVTPDRTEAWRELGDLRTLRGDHAAAAEALAKVTDLEPTNWVAWFQRAQTAGHLGDAASFEAHLLKALEHGFTFRLIEGNPAWRAFLKDPALGRILERLGSVYGDPSLLERLRQGDEQPP